MPIRPRLAPIPWPLGGAAAALLLVTALTCAALADEPNRADEGRLPDAREAGADQRPDRTPPRRSPDLDPSGFEQLCKSQGWGHWWDGTNCLTNEETLRLTREQALEVIRRTFGRSRPIM